MVFCGTKIVLRTRGGKNLLWLGLYIGTGSDISPHTKSR
jgi:hypothetical protein